MQKNTIVRKAVSSIPVYVGIALSAVVLCFAAVVLSLPLCEQSSFPEVSCAGNKWSKFIYGPANEIGDFVAGVSGTLALLWIVITVFIQQKELSFTRAELAGQREALSQEAAISAHVSFSKELDAHLQILSVILGESPLKVCYRDDTDESEFYTFINQPAVADTDSIYSHVRKLSFVTNNLHTIINEFSLKHEVTRHLGYKEAFENALSLMAWVEESLPKMDSGQRALVNSVRLLQLKGNVEALLENCSWTADFKTDEQETR
tara:strand:- start:365 stop:1150 length:786 start_codon:yes stop_codon:yes gene_type:complete